MAAFDVRNSADHPKPYSPTSRRVAWRMAKNTKTGFDIETGILHNCCLRILAMLVQQRRRVLGAADSGVELRDSCTAQIAIRQRNERMPRLCRARRSVRQCLVPASKRARFATITIDSFATFEVGRRLGK